MCTSVNISVDDWHTDKRRLKDYKTGNLKKEKRKKHVDACFKF